MEFKTDQEKFWAGEFGNAYINRNKGSHLLASNLNFFTKALHPIGTLKSCIEFGANIGMNLRALELLYPNISLSGLEINKEAYNKLKEITGIENAYHMSIFDYTSKKNYDLSFIKGVLIHINPKMLNKVYDQLYISSKKYILIAEYYNPTPVTISYRGHNDRLFKRDFAGEFLDRFANTSLVDYGFAYHRDKAFPQDDITWFLIEKNNGN